MEISLNPSKATRILPKLLLAGCALYLVLAAAAGVVIARFSLKVYRRPLRDQAVMATAVEAQFHAKLENISVQAADGATLRGWYIHPDTFNGSAVLLLHGITDNREGVAGFGRLFLEHGYAVLMPDARAHGESGEELATYGIQETKDLHR